MESIAVSALLAWLCFDSIYGLLSLLPVIVLNHLRHQKDAREAWGAKVKEERDNDTSFVTNFQQQFDKMTPEQRNQICQIGEQFMNDAGFDMTKFIENNKKLSENDQVLQIEKQFKEMQSKIEAYDTIYQKYVSVNASAPAPTMSVAGPKTPDVNKLTEYRQEDDLTLTRNKTILDNAFTEKMKKGQDVAVTQTQLGILGIENVNLAYPLRVDNSIKVKVKGMNKDNNFVVGPII